MELMVVKFRGGHLLEYQNCDTQKVLEMPVEINKQKSIHWRPQCGRNAAGNTNDSIIGNNFLYHCELIQRSNSCYEIIKPKLSTKFHLQIAESLISLVR